MNYNNSEIIIDFVEGARLMAAGLATIGLTGAGVGIGTIFGGYLIAVARNPNLRASLFSYVLLGFALTEAIALFALMKKKTFLEFIFINTYLYLLC